MVLRANNLSIKFISSLIMFEKHLDSNRIEMTLASHLRTTQEFEDVLCTSNFNHS